MKTKEYYYSLKYPMEIREIPLEEGGGFTACIPLLGRHTCVGDGETIEEAVASLCSIKDSLIDKIVADGGLVPEPADQQTAMRSFALRLPADLYSQITDWAESGGVSMNRFIVTALAERRKTMDLAKISTELKAEMGAVWADLARSLTVVNQRLSQVMKAVSTQPASPFNELLVSNNAQPIFRAANWPVRDQNAPEIVNDFATSFWENAR
jgi:antitoxin HicB